MRKLKLHMQITVDGFVAGPEGQLDWMANDGDDDNLASFVNRLTDASDTILMGRKMAPEFVRHWEGVLTQPESPETAFAAKMVRMPKVVFSRSVDTIEGKNVRVEKGPLAEAVNELKSRPGKDLIVYGGAAFVSSLMEHGLIDEMNFFVNPTALGKGMQVFRTKTPLKLRSSAAFNGGIVVNTYTPG